jgi:hypothetical protein
VAITRVGGSTGGGNSANFTSLAISLPASIAEDDLIVAGVAVNANTVPSTSTSGYTTVSSDATGNPAYLVTRKFMGATPDSTITINWDTSPTVIEAWRGVDLTTPMDATATTANGASGDPDCASITTVTDGAVVLAFGFLDDDRVTSGGWTPPTGYTNTSSKTTNEPSGSNFIHCSAVVSSKEVSTAGAEDPAAYSSAGDDEWRAVTVALRPAAGGGDPATEPANVSVTFTLATCGAGR